MSARLVDVEGELRVNRGVETLRGDVEWIGSGNDIDENEVPALVRLGLRPDLRRDVGQSDRRAGNHRWTDVGDCAVDGAIDSLGIRRRWRVSDQRQHADSH